MAATQVAAGSPVEVATWVVDSLVGATWVAVSLAERAVWVVVSPAVGHQWAFQVPDPVLHSTRNDQPFQRKGVVYQAAVFITAGNMAIVLAA